jgi:sugar O-acyltransferase (sialic acid O-acetyltransferase NeuD family)
MPSINPRELLIIGAGGFGAVVAGIAEQMNKALGDPDGARLWEVIGYADNDPAKRGMRHAGHVVHCSMEEAGRMFHGRALWFFCAIGDNRARARMARRAREFGWTPATLIHPTAVLDPTVEVGPGSVIAPCVVLSFQCRIGSHVVVDAHASLGHHAVLEDFCEVFSGARLNGNCRVGQYAVIGCNATLLPGTRVGDRAVVGANSLAHGAVEADTTVFGVPARTLHRTSFAIQPVPEPVMRGE